MPSDDEIPLLRSVNYTIYDRTTGEILMWGMAGSPKSVNAKVQAGQGLILDEQIDGSRYRIDPVTGIAVRKTEAPE